MGRQVVVAAAAAANNRSKVGDLKATYLSLYEVVATLLPPRADL